jgi:hypothetical protein
MPGSAAPQYGICVRTLAFNSYHFHRLGAPHPSAAIAPPWEHCVKTMKKKYLGGRDARIQKAGRDVRVPGRAGRPNTKGRTRRPRTRRGMGGTSKYKYRARRPNAEGRTRRPLDAGETPAVPGKKHRKQSLNS